MGAGGRPDLLISANFRKDSGFESRLTICPTTPEPTRVRPGTVRNSMTACSICGEQNDFEPCALFAADEVQNKASQGILPAWLAKGLLGPRVLEVRRKLDTGVGPWSEPWRVCPRCCRPSPQLSRGDRRAAGVTEPPEASTGNPIPVPHPPDGAPKPPGYQTDEQPPADRHVIDRLPFSVRPAGDPTDGIDVTLAGLHRVSGRAISTGELWEYRSNLGDHRPWQLLVAPPLASSAPTGQPPLATLPTAEARNELDLAPHIRHARRTTASLASEQVTFQAVMAEQLRQAPWFALSLALHALLLLLLLLLAPIPASAASEMTVQFLENPLGAQLEMPPISIPAVVIEEPTEPLLVLHDEPSEVTAIELVDPTHDSPSQDEMGWGAATEISGRSIDSVYGSREGGKAKGARAEVEAINAGLLWLRNHQDADGRWDCDNFMKHDDPHARSEGGGSPMHDVGVTALALLAFLGDGNTISRGPHHVAVRHAVKWLKQQQQENGLFGTGESTHFIYDHAIATYALCEACGLSHSTLMMPVAQRGLDYLEQHRNPEAAWRYGLRDGDNDLSITGWCIMANESGAHFGLNVPASARAQPIKWLESVMDTDGSYGYTTPYDYARLPPDVSAGTTAVGLFCRFFTDRHHNTTNSMRKSADYILTRPPVWSETAESIDVYYWYYATYALFQMGGRYWTQWHTKLQKAVIATQERDKTLPSTYGSWNPTYDGWGSEGGRVYTTAMLTLTLQAYYRYSRLLR